MWGRGILDRGLLWFVGWLSWREGFAGNVGVDVCVEVSGAEGVAAHSGWILVQKTPSGL